MKNLLLVTVYHYETPEEGVVRRYRTREGIVAKGGKVLEDTVREVPAYEVTAFGLWKPGRNPVV